MKKLFVIILIIVNLIFLCCNNNNNKSQTSNNISNDDTSIIETKKKNTIKNTCNEDTVVFKMKDKDITGAKNLKEYFSENELAELEIDPNTEIPCTIDLSFLSKEVAQDYIGLLNHRWLLTINGTDVIRNLKIFDVQHNNKEIGSFVIASDHDGEGDILTKENDIYTFWYVSKAVEPEGHEECADAKEYGLDCSLLEEQSFNINNGTFTLTGRTTYILTN